MKEGARYLRLAASVRYYAGDDDTLRFRGQPASHVAGFSLLGEYLTSSVSSGAAGDPRFDGYYVTAAWVLSGEHRPYDRKAGYAKRVMPQGRWGAWELMARYGRVDQDDGLVHGGVMDGWWAGVNWWATRRWKAGITCGDIDLDRDGLDGNTRTWLSRIQWIY